MRSLTVRKSASFCACRSLLESICGESFMRHDVREIAILESVTGPVERSGLASSIAAVAEVCRDAFAGYADANGVPSGELSRWALFAIALLEATESDLGVTDSDLRRMRDAASAAAAVSRTQVPDKAAIALAAAFAEAERLCSETLGAGAAQASRRFLFGDADLAVTRAGTLWRVRSGAIEFEDPLLGSALALACSWLSPGRVGELAMQILDWDAHAGPDAV